MEIRDNDIIVIPEGMDVPGDFPHQYHRIKHLHSPSIVFSHRGFMDIAQPLKSTSKFILGLLGKIPEVEVGPDLFYRYVRIKSKKTGEYLHNKGATVLVDLRLDEGKFYFTFVTCNHLDNFNKMIARNECKERMEGGEAIECINYDPSLSILQNIFIAIGVQQGVYPLTDYDWKGILPEFYGEFTTEQKESLSTLRRLIRDKPKA